MTREKLKEIIKKELGWKLKLENTRTSKGQ